ncbi:MAG: hypothetical protein NVS3B25_30880 [Hymenobacter sp.]
MALGAALFVLLAEGMPGDASAPGRVAAQIITGIGFLGAVAILRRDSSTVTGLTTAATVWCAGAIGTLAGLGAWYQALLGTGFILVANVLLRPLDLLINRWGHARRHVGPRAAAAPAPVEPGYRVRVALPAAAEPAAVARVLTTLLAHQPQAIGVEPRAELLWVSAEVPGSAQQLAGLLAALQAQPGVAQVRGVARPAAAPEGEVD